MAVPRTAIGFRLHTGWAALVAVTGGFEQTKILLRRRLELLPVDGSIPRFVYHSAAEMNAAESAALVKRAAAGAHKTAKAALKEAVEELRRMGVAVHAAGIPTGSTQVPGELDRILKSHPLIHAAEGALFQEAVAHACETCGLHVTTVRERDLMTRAAEAYRTEPVRLRASLDALRKTAGAPWSADQKTAAAAAWLALRDRG